MTTWVKVTPDSAAWQGAGTLLWLLTESGENMLNEDGDLWLLEESKIDTWTKKNNTSPTWTQITPS
jgi:hypothetical protein